MSLKVKHFFLSLKKDMGHFLISPKSILVCFCSLGNKNDSKINVEVFSVQKQQFLTMSKFLSTHYPQVILTDHILYFLC